MLMEVVSRVLPGFFEQLRDRVYPTFARLAVQRPGVWGPEGTFEAVQLQADLDRQLMPLLVAWARRFHAEEPWILEGAMQTLWHWHRDPAFPKSLDICGFRPSCCVDTLSSDEERLFTFEHASWDPQLQRWADFRASISKQFRNHLDAYKQALSSLMTSRGAVSARNRYCVAHFEWFALYQLGGMSSKRILGERPHLTGDESTIIKGVRDAAGLLKWKSVRKARKSRAQSPA
jgi:hypothetical protein